MRMKVFFLVGIMSILLMLQGCDTPVTPKVAAVHYNQYDQMGKPGITILFLEGARKDSFNVTPPSQQAAAFASEFQTQLLKLNPDFTTNLTGKNAQDYANFLATDVLSVSLDDKTTFYGSTLFFTGRALTDDVMNTQLRLIFGGPDGTLNPGLTDDHVNGNDKAFLPTFPYVAASN